VTVRVRMDQRTARASGNGFSTESLRKLVEEAVTLTRAAEPDPGLPELAEPAPIEPVERHFSRTAEATPAERAEAARQAIAEVESRGLTAAGIYSTSESALAILNTRGVFAYHTETMAQFSITALGGDSSGWAKASACDRDSLDHVSLAARAAEKAVHSARPIELPPGRYTVVLEPAAVLDLAGQMFGDFSATALRDGRSFLARRMGTRLFGENIRIVDDVRHPTQSGAPFDAEGVPRRPLTLVEAGVPREIAWSRQAALAEGVEPTGHGFGVPNEYGEWPQNIVIPGDSTSLAEMIASTGHGILVTRLWYIREVDPYEKIMTGMTRDGTFLIENGQVTAGLRNFRFNQSLVEMMNHVEAMSPGERASGEEAADMVVPAMKVREFQFTEVTRF
jgi:predicted Zn-dependent protease